MAPKIRPVPCEISTAVNSSAMVAITIRSMKIYDLIYFDRLNENAALAKSGRRKKIFSASIVFGVAGTLLLLTRSLPTGILGNDQIFQKEKPRYLSVFQSDQDIGPEFPAAFREHETRGVLDQPAHDADDHGPSCWHCLESPTPLPLPFLSEP